MLPAHGRERWVAWINRVQRGPNGEKLLHAVGRDVTARKQAERALRAAKDDLELQTAILSSVIEAIPAMVMVLDADLRFRLVNRAYELWRDRSRTDLIGVHYLDAVGKDEYDRSIVWARRALAGETVSFQKDYPQSPRHRHINMNYIPLRMAGGSIGGLIGVGIDITMQRDEERRLVGLTERDPLTTLLNRTGLVTYMQSQWADGGAGSLALLHIDLDGFKPVNDLHGHAVGDELLRQVALRLQRTVRPTDAVARLSDDEFAVALPGILKRSDAQAVADKIAAAAALPFAFSGLELVVGASVGVALQMTTDADWQSLAERADADLYEAKKRNRQ
jgi:diguanylate cyclase (GGDEF)-like protein/PAS domain S-box-containing protein